jgi:hypothetical protein
LPAVTALSPGAFNPARGVEKFREQTRERYLSVEQLGRLGSTLRLAETDRLSWLDRPTTSKHERKSEIYPATLSLRSP